MYEPYPRPCSPPCEIGSEPGCDGPRAPRRLARLQTDQRVIRDVRLGKTGVTAIGALVFASLFAFGCGGGDSSTVTEAHTTTVYLPSGGSASDGYGGRHRRQFGQLGGPRGQVDRDPDGRFLLQAQRCRCCGRLGEDQRAQRWRNHPRAGTGEDRPRSGQAPDPCQRRGRRGEARQPRRDPRRRSRVDPTTTVDLKPGKYAVICNLPGHYAQGMYGSLTVSGG